MVALSNCMVIGDKRKYLAMLVSLKTEINMETGAPLDKLAADSLFVGKSIARYFLLSPMTMQLERATITA